MVEKRLRKDFLITTFILVIFIFASGAFLGFYLDNFRVNDTDKILRESELDTESLVTERLFSENFDIGDCNLVNKRLDELSKTLVKVGELLTEYDEKALFKEEDYNFLKRKYFLLEMRTYIFMKQLKDSCNLDSKVILYFYDIDQKESLEQGYALDVLVNRNMKVYILSIDREFNEPLLNLVKEYYGVNSSPKLIIDYDNILDGPLNSGELIDLLK